MNWLRSGVNQSELYEEIVVECQPAINFTHKAAVGWLMNDDDDDDVNVVLLSVDDDLLKLLEKKSQRKIILTVGEMAI